MAIACENLAKSVKGKEALAIESFSHADATLMAYLDDRDRPVDERTGPEDDGASDGSGRRERDSFE